METKIIGGMKWVSKYILFLLLALIVFCMILGTMHVFILVFQSVDFKNLNPIDINSIASIFGFILIILVGHELFNAILHTINHKKIPVKEIMQIAMIALGNKVITLDIKAAGMNIMIGVGVTIFSLGLSYFFYNNRITTVNRKDQNESSLNSDSMIRASKPADIKS
jgi:uncharacterized membrane protein (DUF373 family)